MNITTPYYEDNTRVSNSAIGWFLKKGPSYFHKMLTGEIAGEKTAAMDRGSMIHEYILQPEEFQKHYVVWDKSRPSSIQQEKFCQALASSLEIEPNRAILDAYKEAYSTRGKSEDLMLSEGLKIASTLKDYIDFLKQNDGRILISHWDWQMLKKIKQNIENHKAANALVKAVSNVKCLNALKPDKSYHEFHINWEYYGEMPVACKSLLDGLILSFEIKKAIIYDLKTTQKLWHFEDSIDEYDYCRQLMFYTMAVKWYLEHELQQDVSKWKFEYYIIGIDTTGIYDIRVFKVPQYAVESRLHTIIDTLTEIAWHQANNKWDHSLSYYEGSGSENLNL